MRAAVTRRFRYCALAAVALATAADPAAAQDPAGKPGVASLIAALALASPAQAQGRAQREAAEYPSKPIRFVVPSSPGGGADVLARSLGLRMAESFDKPVVIENRAGAGGIIGYEIVARAPSDGYTLLIVAGG